MTVNIYCYNYNNYYNRIVKKENTLSGYGEPIYVEQGVNFNFSDGVDTTQVLNTDLNPDYIVLVDTNGNIISRWFVIDANYTRNGQHVFTLHRDVIADKYDEVLNADVFIEKATLPSDNPLIYNSEDIAVNQIKKSETALKDKTGVAWICGYIARKEFGGAGDPSAEIYPNAHVIGDLRCEDALGNLKPISQYDYNEGDEVYFPWDEDLIIQYQGIRGSGQHTLPVSGAIKIGMYGLNDNFYTVAKDSNLGYNLDAGRSYSDLVSNLNTLDIAKIRVNLQKYSTYYGRFNLGAFNFLTLNKGKIIEASDGYYRLSYDTTYIDSVYTVKTDVEDNYIYSALVSKYPASPSSTNGAAFIKEKVLKTTVHITRIQSGEFSIKMPNPDYRYQLKDAPYDMFCIPCPIDKSNVTIKNSAVSGWQNINLSKDTAIQFAQGIATSLGSFLYDLQLLPYCPLTIDVDYDGSLDINNNDSKQEGQTTWPLRYTLIMDNPTTVPNPQAKGVILWALASQGTANIVSWSNKSVGNVKLENQCDMYRVVSGNYGSSFNINIAKNKGLKNFTVDYTYLPYNPYIHVNPEFNELYGRDFNDCRGLIDQSDKSISYLSDAWIQYQINNKTYQQQFDRQIQNMEIQNKYQKTNDIVNAAVGAVKGGVSGAVAGSVVPGIGTAAGAVVGTVTSAIGGIIDVSMNEKLRNEALDYTKDMFGYQLENIQALPQSIAKITAYSINNKVFPIVEYYSCTDMEKEAVAKKIAFNGMTVMTIGKISDYINNRWSYGDITDKGYIKGKLIKIDIDDDFHIVNTIAAELNKGVYTNG